MENASLLNISSSYIIKQTFSFICYHRFISLIKYNKKYQNHLEFNLKNNIHLDNNNEKKEENRINSLSHREDPFRLIGLIGEFPIFGPIYIYFIIHYILNFSLTIKLNNENKSKSFLWRLISGFFVKKLLILIYIVSFYVLYHAVDFSRNEYRNKKLIYLFLLDIILIFHTCYEILLIYKIKTIFSFALNGKWMIIFDVIYLIANFIFICYSFHIGKKYLQGQEHSNYTYCNYLFLFRDIKIKKFELPDDYDTFKNKRKYLESQANYFEIDYSNDDIDFIKNINKFRSKKNLDELIIDYKIPNFIIKGSTEIALSPNNIIKISDTKYIFKLNNEDNFDKFEEDRNILQILLEPFLNKINIIRQNDIKYITVFEDFDNKNYEMIKILKNL